MISAQPHKTVQEKLIDQLMKSTNDQVSSELEDTLMLPRLTCFDSMAFYR